MLFNSVTFVIFFIIVFALYNALNKNYKLQNFLLLAASYVFYGWWNWKLLAIISFSIAFDYFAAKIIYGETAQKRRKLFLIASMAVNLGLLGFFKYFNFFTQSLVELLHSIGIYSNFYTLNIILPIGISFYTFHSINYVVDVYRGKIKPANSLFEYALFVSFFPQLVAGPILRAADLLPQFQKARVVTRYDYDLGFWLIAWGLFKKIVIADNCALIVDKIFKHGSLLGSGDIIMGTLLFSFQIYCDFSGYSDMAIGLGRLLGFKININFNLPYLARNIREFWQRWHISLSTWLRDYLYIPLGGNKCGSFKTCRNLMITMLLGGLWHGANWTFVIWGGYHGLALVTHRFIENKIKVWMPIKVLSTFCVVNFGWLIFRADSFEHLREIMSAFLKGFSLKQAYPGLSELAFYILFLIIFQLIQFRKKDLYFVTKTKTIKVFLYSLIVIFIVLSGNFSAHQFIYFQF